MTNVSPAQPIFAAIELSAAPWEGYSRSYARTMRTARSRTSGEYRFRAPMTPILAGNGVSGKSGVIQTRSATLFGDIPERSVQGYTMHQCLESMSFRLAPSWSAASPASARAKNSFSTSYIRWRKGLKPILPIFGVSVLSGLINPLAAQSPAGMSARTPLDTLLAQAAAAITTADLGRQWAVLASDSMRGSTPSPGLDRAARYLAAQFEGLGLSLLKKKGAAPSADDTLGRLPVITLPVVEDLGDEYGILRYPIPGQFLINYDRARIIFYTLRRSLGRAIFMEGGNEVPAQASEVSFATTGRFLNPTMSVVDYVFPLHEYRPSVLLAGPHTITSVRAVDLKGKTVVYIPPLQVDTLDQAAIVRELVTRSKGVVIVSPSDSVEFATRQRLALAHPPGFVSEYLPKAQTPWVVEVLPSGIAEVFDLNEVRLAELRAASVPTTQPLPRLSIGVGTWEPLSKAEITTAPNVVAVLPGSDRRERRRFVVVTAPLDAPTGTLGLLALAKALSLPGVRPKYSLVFLATSGGDEFWGNYYLLYYGMRPRLVLALDLEGQLTSDSAIVAGLHDVKVIPPVTWIAAQHAELGVTVVDRGSVVSLKSRAGVFSDRWVPILEFRVAGSQVPMSSGETPVTGDLAATTRFFQMMFYITHALTDGTEPPRWTPDGRDRITEQIP